MKSLVKTTTLQERYRAGVRVLNNAIKDTHPDTAARPDAQMVSRLVATKERWTELYKRLAGK